MWHQLRTSPAYKFFLLLCLLVIAEAAIMLLLGFLFGHSHPEEIILDSTLLALVVAPALYFYIIKPYRNTIHNLQDKETKLATLKDNLQRNLSTLGQNLNSIVENIDDAIFVLDHSEDTVLFANPKAVELYGLYGYDLIETRIVPHLTNGDGAEISLHHSRHSERHFNISQSVVMWDGAKSRLVSLRDTTKIYDLRDRLQLILDSLSDAIILMNSGHTVVYANPAAEKMFQRTHDELVGKTFGFPIVHDETTEIDVIGKDGSLTPTEVRSAHIHLDGESGILASFRDIAAHKELLQSVEDQSIRLVKILENAPSAIITSNDKGIIESFNPAAEKMFGYSKDEIIGENVSCLTPEEHAQQHDGYIRNYLNTGISKLLGKSAREEKARRKDGSLFPILITISKMEISGKTIFIGMITDISKDKKNQEALFQAQKMEVVGNLTGGIAHDFNNILGIALGNLQLLNRKLKDEPSLNAYIETSTKAILRGSDLTKQLLAFSRRQELEPRVIDVNELVSGMEKILHRTLGEHITVKTILEDPLPHVKADPAQLESAILNLSINARDAMHKNGILLIETFTIDLDENYQKIHSYAGTGPHVCISITDNGCGMPKDMLEEIFQPFFTTKDVGKGTGLGLSMVFGFVKQSKGHVTVYSEEGHGSTFRIYLPCLPDHIEIDPSTALEQDDGDDFQGQGELVLLVEDDVLFLKMAEELLKDNGYQVITAHDGPSAIKLFEREGNVDILLTDMIMPGGMNGHELALKIQELKPGIPVLLASGYPRDAFKEGRRFPLISKPYTRSNLLKALRNAINEGNVQNGE